MTGEITVTIPKKANLVFQVQNVQGTAVWAVVEKGELEELVEKARLYDLESHDRLSFEADKLTRQFALNNPLTLEEMIAADTNSKKTRNTRWREV